MQKGDVKWGLETYVAHEQSEVMGKWTLSILNHSSVASINRSSTSYVNQRKCHCSKMGRSIISPGPSFSPSSGSTFLYDCFISRYHMMVRRKVDTPLHQTIKVFLYLVNSDQVYRPIPEEICGTSKV